MFCTKRFSQIDVLGAARARHLPSERLRDLHGHRSDDACSAVDQDPVTGLDFAAF
jgi:hypothetical protein